MSECSSRRVEVEVSQRNTARPEEQHVPAHQLPTCQRVPLRVWATAAGERAAASACRSNKRRRPRRATPDSCARSPSERSSGASACAGRAPAAARVPRLSHCLHPPHPTTTTPMRPTPRCPAECPSRTAAEPAEAH